MKHRGWNWRDQIVIRELDHRARSAYSDGSAPSIIIILDRLRSRRHQYIRLRGRQARDMPSVLISRRACLKGYMTASPITTPSHPHPRAYRQSTPPFRWPPSPSRLLHPSNLHLSDHHHSHSSSQSNHHLPA